MESFEQVARLEPPALRELFARGRPEQRVWAIWALALRTGGGVFTANAVRDPDAGVRRTIAVMLAGHGEHEMLIELARHDPIGAVRESAMQLVTRLASQGVIAPEVVLDAARTDPYVRSAILAAIDRGAPPFLVELAMRFLESGTPLEQADAFEALIRTESRDMCSAALAWLETLPNTTAREGCSRMARAVGDYAFASELTRASRRLRVLAVGALHRPSWAVVELLVGDDLDLLLAIVREGRIDVPITALARAALDGQATPLVDRLTADLALLEAPSDELRPLLPLLERHYGEWIAVLEEADDDREIARERALARKHLVKLRKQLQRLMQS